MGVVHDWTVFGFGALLLFVSGLLVVAKNPLHIHWYLIPGLFFILASLDFRGILLQFGLIEARKKRYTLREEDRF